MKNRNTQLVEIVVPGISGGNQQQRIQINDQPYLRGASIWSLEVFNGTDITKSPQNNDVVTSALMKGAFLTLYLTDVSGVNGPGEYIQLLPFNTMHTLNNFVSPFEFEPFELMGQIVSWDKCYITLGAPLANTANMSFLINVGFMFSKGNNTN